VETIPASAIDTKLAQAVYTTAVLLNCGPECHKHFVNAGKSQLFSGEIFSLTITGTTLVMNRLNKNPYK
jgi:hypothetical protein